MNITWLICALLASLVWATANLIDKVLREKYIRSSMVLTILWCLLSIIFVVVIFLITGFTSINLKALFLGISAGLASAIGLLFYVKALAREEVSRVIIWLQCTPLIVLLLATIFLNEILTNQQYLAFGLIFIGGLLVVVKKIKGKLVIGLGVGLALFSALFYALQDILLKYNSYSTSFWQSLLYLYLGLFLGGLVFLCWPKYYRETLKTIKSLNKKAFSLIFISKLTGFLGFLFFIGAIYLGSVSLTSVLGGIQPLLVFVAAIFISKKFPTILKEGIEPRELVLKSIALVFILVGIYFLYV